MHGKQISTLPLLTKFMHLYFGLLNLKPCGPKMALIIVLWSGYLSHVSLATRVLL